MQLADSEEAALPQPDELSAYRQALDDTELVLLAQQLISVGRSEEARDICRRSPAPPSARGLRLCEARALFVLGESEAALDILDGLLASEPRDSLAAYHKAQLLAQSGNEEKARATLRELIGATPNFPGALALLAQLTFPGPPYREVLRRLHERLRPRTYLEIGVEHGATLQLAVHSQLVCGVDPVPRRIPHRLPAGTRLFHVTSDAFFASEAPGELFGNEPLDLAFIDGMHSFEFTLRDFANVERWCHAGSTVVLHDCLPVAEVAASRERQTSFWVGDCWKALECLLRERLDLRISVVPCHPSGLVLIQRLDPGSRWSAERLATLHQQYLSLPCPDSFKGWPSHYPLVSNHDPELNRFISSLVAPGSSAGAHREPA
jgi:tetratricopeptide (TPR) repeat protein